MNAKAIGNGQSAMGGPIDTRTRDEALHRVAVRANASHVVFGPDVSIEVDGRPLLYWSSLTLRARPDDVAIVEIEAVLSDVELMNAVGEIIAEIPSLGPGRFRIVPVDDAAVQTARQRRHDG